MSTNVDLGFFNGDHPAWDLEKDYEDFEVESRHFPCKVGGKPAWLDLAKIPKEDQIKCGLCGATTTYLLQLYTPDSTVATAFHRTIFVFICVKPTCWNESNNSDDASRSPVVVLRSQLSRENSFYPSQAPEPSHYWRPDITASKFGAVCAVCGLSGDKTCGQCRTVSYCGKTHQKQDWKAGHKAECKAEGKVVYGGPHHIDGFKEGIIDIEEEPDEEPDADKLDKRYTEAIDPAMMSEDTRDVDDSEWDEVDAESSNQTDKASEAFNSRTRRAPRQIVRHDRHGKPLLCSYTRKLLPPTNCKCGAKRSFEFQVMPQLLNLLGCSSTGVLDADIDWGSIYVFTCTKSCDTEGYEREEAQVLHFDNSSLQKKP